MTMSDKLSNAEKLVMKVIWDAGCPITCREVIDRLYNNYGRNYADTTVYTFLTNIKKKGYISSQRKGVNFFEAIKDRDVFIREELKDFMMLWLDDDKEKIKAYIDEL